VDCFNDSNEALNRQLIGSFCRGGAATRPKRLCTHIPGRALPGPYTTFIHTPHRSQPGQSCPGGTPMQPVGRQLLLGRVSDPPETPVHTHTGPGAARPLHYLHSQPPQITARAVMPGCYANAPSWPAAFVGAGQRPARNACAHTNRAGRCPAPTLPSFTPPTDHSPGSHARVARQCSQLIGSFCRGGSATRPKRLCTHIPGRALPGPYTTFIHTPGSNARAGTPVNEPFSNAVGTPKAPGHIWPGCEGLRLFLVHCDAGCVAAHGLAHQHLHECRIERQQQVRRKGQPPARPLSARNLKPSDADAPARIKR